MKWENRRLKHVDIQYNFVKDLHNDETIEVKYTCSNDQKADIFTKSLPLFKNNICIYI